MTSGRARYVPGDSVRHEDEQSRHWSRYPERGCGRLMFKGREGGNLRVSLFFFSGTCARGRAVTARAHDLCMRVKSRVATSGKRNWSRYAPCEKATEINARACEDKKSPAILRWASSRDCNGKNWRRWSRVSKSNCCENWRCNQRCQKRIFESNRIFWEIFH